jgi:hypothetical protein
MQIGSLASSALYQMEQGSVRVNGVDTPTTVGVAMLSKELAHSAESGSDLVRAMERSVNPDIGGNIDTYA